MRGPNALVTGASSGIGRAVALALSARGWTVYATVRSKEDGVVLQQEGGTRIVPVRLDLCDTWLVQEAAGWVNDRVGAAGLQALVNNAGIAATGPIEDLRGDELRRQFDVNVFGAVALSKALLPSLRRGRGRIVNIGSSSGQVTLPFAGAYSASKAALAALTAAMRLELAAQGVNVSLIETGNIRTPLWDKTVARTDPELASEPYRKAIDHARGLTERMAASAAPTAWVVRAVLRAIGDRRPRAVYVVGHDARVWRLVARFLPAGWRERFFRRLFRLGAARRVPAIAPSFVAREASGPLSHPTGVRS